MSIGPVHVIDHLLHQYGYGAVFAGVALESIGLPLPGESLMIAAAIYAAATHALNIFILVPVAAAGAICGDQTGYFIGRWIGYRLLRHWGKKIGLSDERLDLARYLFRRYGGVVVFFGRFVAILRTFVSLLSGANRMPWHTFLLWNSLGGVAWTCLYGFGAFALGKAAERIGGPVGITLGVIGAIMLVLALLFIKRNERQLLDDARRDMQRQGGTGRQKLHPAG